MPCYVDGYLVPVPKRKIAAYRHLALKAGRVWRDHGDKRMVHGGFKILVDLA